MTRSLLAVLLVAVSLSCTTKVEVAEDASKSLDGHWSAAAAEFGGEKFPDEIRKSIHLSIQDGKYTVTVGAQPDVGTIKIDATKNPKTLDIVGGEGPNQGKTMLAIYEMTGDNLRICYDLSGQVRPAEFKTAKGTQQFLVTYEREKH